MVDVNYSMNISGCLRNGDVNEAAKWLEKSLLNLCQNKYKHLIIQLSGEYPSIFNGGFLSKYKADIKTLDESKEEIILALKKGDYTRSNNIYKSYFTYSTFPDYINLLNKYKKENYISSIKSSVKDNLSVLERELLLDVLTLLKYPEKTFSKRVKASKANFYFIKNSQNSQNSLSLIEGVHSEFSRHITWDHVNAREILSKELGEKSEVFGTVLLSGDYVPKENDLLDVCYSTSSGRDYFSSAIGSLTNSCDDIDRRIDIDSFMSMKEVIPTSTQIKAIFADGNYVIDGAAGTGKSTSLLQKLLTLKKNGVKSQKLVVLVKHEMLVDPFMRLLLDMDVDGTMNMKGINIESVSGFLKSHFGSSFDQVTLADIDETELESKSIKNAIDTILNLDSPSESDIENFPIELINISVIEPVFCKYCKLQREHKKVISVRSEIVEKILKNIEKEFGMNSKLIEKKRTEETLDRRFIHRKELDIDDSNNKKIMKIRDEYVKIKEILLISDDDKKVLYKPIVESLKNEFLSLETRVYGMNKDKTLRLDEHIQSKITDEVSKYEEELVKELEVLKREGLMRDDVINMGKKVSDLGSLIVSAKNEIRSLCWNGALIKRSDSHKRMICLNGNVDLVKNKYNTVIIDEAQDVPVNYIELVNFYSEQLILSGDEAQKENENGLGEWNNIREKLDFSTDGVLSIFKLRHNFRQTYELGSLSYNYRQILLGKGIEDLESDYFENQKGFNIPSIVNINILNDLIDEKLRYVSDSFVQKFPLVIISDSSYSQSNIIANLDARGIKVSSDGLSSEIDVLVLNSSEVAGREYPVVISVLSDSMKDSTVYILLSRAKFDLTLVVPTEYKMNNAIKRLIDYKILAD